MTEIKSSGNPRGAGRKPLPPGQKKVKRTVTLSPDLVADLAEHGGGILSKGIEMSLRNTVVMDDAGKVLGMVHIGPGSHPFQAWRRRRHTDGRGNVHTHLGFFDTIEAATEAVRRGR